MLKKIKACLYEYLLHPWILKYSLVLTNLFLDAYMCYGKGKHGAGEISLLVLGKEPGISYMTSLVYAESPRRKALGKKPVFSVFNGKYLNNCRPDLVFVRVNDLSAAFLKRKDVFIVPEWLDFEKAAPIDFQNISDIGRLSYKFRKNIRGLKRKGYYYSISHDYDDFEMFYERMYRPYVLKRHKELAEIYSRATLKHYFKKGGLVVVKKKKDTVSAALYFVNGDAVYFHSFGVMNGEDAHLKEGAVGALCDSCLHWAKDMGCKSINLGGARPLINDGLFRFKRRWGMGIKRRRRNHYSFAIGIFNLSSAVKSFLASNPFIFCDNGGLNGFIFKDEKAPLRLDDIRRFYTDFWTPGIRRLYLTSASGFERDIFDKDIQGVDRKRLREIFTLIDAKQEKA